MTLLLFLGLLQAQESVERKVDVKTDVVILVNDDLSVSRELGEYYAKRRGIPREQILGLNTSPKEIITWAEFRVQILGPVREFLKSRPKVLYVVPMYGVPVKTAEENPANDAKKGDPQARFVNGRDYCCIDREIELLKKKHPTEGWIASTTYRLERRIAVKDGIYIVVRLDGPTPESVRRLIDNAIFGETYGISGDCLLDTRGLTEGNYAAVDQEMKGIAKLFQKKGLNFIHDDKPEVVTLGTYQDASHYWGWYAGNVRVKPEFRFNRGAVGAHLHSFSASRLRTKNRRWTGPLIEHGITGTCGTVYEPLSSGFPMGTVFFARFLGGYNFGQSMQMANQFTSWMAVFVGDPLYAPYAKGMAARQKHNRELAISGVAKLESLLDRGDVAAAKKIADGLSTLPEPPGGDALPFLLREVRARSLSEKSAKGTVAELRKLIGSIDPLGGVKKTLALARRGVAMSEYNFECNLLAGQAYLDKKITRSALPYLKRAVQVDPKSGQAQISLGKAYQLGKDYEGALRAFGAAYAADGSSDGARAMGEVLFHLKRYEEALPKLEAAHSRRPDDRSLALLLGKGLLLAKKPGKAVPVLEKAVEAHPIGPEELALYRECWKQLLKANRAAGDRAKAGICSKIVKGFPAERRSA